MKISARHIGIGAVLTALAVLLAVFPLHALVDLGAWLRRASLFDAAGNFAAWAIVLCLSALPALGLLWRGRCWWDLLLLLAAGEIFAGLYFLVNPTLLHPMLGAPAASLWAFAACGSVAATLLAWAVLRGLRRLERTERLGRTLEALLRWSAVLLGWLAVWSQCGALLGKLRAVAGANTAPDVDLLPTNLSLCLLAAANLLPMLLGCAVLLWAGKLARALESDPFGGETVALAQRLSRRCAGVASASVLVCALGNLLQMLLFPFLHDMHFQVSFPACTALLAAAMGLLCRYFRRAKAVSDDNETSI